MTCVGRGGVHAGAVEAAAVTAEGIMMAAVVVGVGVLVMAEVVEGEWGACAVCPSSPCDGRCETTRAS